MKKLLDKPVFLLPLAFMLHNIEEVFGMENWSKTIPSYIHSPVTTEQFAIAAGLITVLGFVIVFAEKYYGNQKQFALITTAFTGMLFLNVFFPHLICTIFFKQYAPGVITGVFINLPLSGYILWTTYQTQKLNLKEIITASVIGGFVGIALAFTLLKIGEVITT